MPHAYRWNLFHLNDIVFVKSLFVDIPNNQVMQMGCQCYFRLLHSPHPPQKSKVITMSKIVIYFGPCLVGCLEQQCGCLTRNIKLLHWALPWISSCPFCSVIFTCISLMNWLSLNEIVHFEIHIWSIQTIEDYVKGRSHYATHVFWPINHWHSLLKITIKP